MLKSVTAGCLGTKHLRFTVYTLKSKYFILKDVRVNSMTQGH